MGQPRLIRLAAAALVVLVAGGSLATSVRGSTWFDRPATVTKLPGPLHAIGPPTRTSVDTQPVPGNLRPPLDQARNDVPVTYTDGCHLGFFETQPRQCVFGDPASRTVVVLFGDSKAGQWFPALAQLATARHWRLVSLTKSACAAADVTVWNSSLDRPYLECDTWRTRALARLAVERPTLVIVADDRFYDLAINGKAVPVAERPAVWKAGLARTLARLHAASRAVVVIGDTPRSRVDPPVCLAAHLANALLCATPAKQAIDVGWLARERATAGASGARFIDPSPWVCPSDPCPAVIGRLLVYREPGHLTATFAAALAVRLGAALQIP